MSILSENKIMMNAVAKDKYEAIAIAGQLLVEGDHVTKDYIPKMLEREEVVSTYMGGGLAIPHGTKDAKPYIKSTGLSIARFPEGVDFGGDEPAFVVIGIAAAGDEHMEVLTNVAMIFTEDDAIERIMNAASPLDIIGIFEGGVQV
ncbi:PTS system, mannitol-specific IIA component [Paenibacillus sophorae]|uniref:Mannitol-specific phosphotransferase enzyme IIA component n=1 Tax=Paenibacillus sophorae TaxID=1333845 RepID=A0A1H8M262_9BACL|nr:PTS sugar transporter subunit IIA [Paenibacillus sophorae]QWU17642.1 PTS sugar transporter subunit IIA [Paenibacillus sophorae]SEO11370.1 PTS system, mannitol-specific IIA component [Paenibacillus sophorae]